MRIGKIVYAYFKSNARSIEATTFVPDPKQRFPKILDLPRIGKIEEIHGTNLSLSRIIALCPTSLDPI